MDLKDLTLGDLEAIRPDLVAALHQEGADRERRRSVGLKNADEEKRAAEWAASTKLQDEYPTVAAYVATMRHRERAASHRPS